MNEDAKRECTDDNPPKAQYRQKWKAANWDLARSLYFQRFPIPEIVIAAGVTEAALCQRRSREKWVQLRDKIAATQSALEAAKPKPKAELPETREPIIEVQDTYGIEVWSDRMRRKVMKRAELLLNDLGDNDPKALAVLKDVADIVRKLSDRGQAGAVADAPVDIGRVRDVAG